MKTVIKFPVYVEIETDNIDRKVVTDAANSILYPSLLKYLSSAKYKREIVQEFKDATGVDNLFIQMLTEIDLFRDRIK